MLPMVYNKVDIAKVRGLLNIDRRFLGYVVQSKKNM
jgi:hypothetical protein